MRQLLDLFPVLVFFIAFFVGGRDFFIATQAIIVATAIQLAILWFLDRKISQMHLIGGLAIFVLGGITVLIRDEAFLQWKVTIVNWLFAAGFFASHYIGEQPIIQRMMNSAIPNLPRKHWITLSTMWAGFFFFLGALNLYIMNSYSIEFWVKFKLFGLVGLSLVFTLVQGIWLATKLPKESLTNE